MVENVGWDEKLVNAGAPGAPAVDPMSLKVHREITVDSAICISGGISDDFFVVEMKGNATPVFW